MDDDQLLQPGGPPYFYDTLEKGTRVSIQKLEHILGLEKKKDEEAFEWALRRLQGDIHEKTEMTVVIRRDGLEVLTDDQASSYNMQLIEHGKRIMFRRQQKNLEVNVANLQPDRRAVHDKNLERTGRLLNAMQAELKRIRLENGNASKQLTNGKHPKKLREEGDGGEK